MPENCSIPTFSAYQGPTKPTPSNPQIIKKQHRCNIMPSPTEEMESVVSNLPERKSIPSIIPPIERKSTPSIIPSTERKSIPSIIPLSQIDSLPSVIPLPTERKSTPSIISPSQIDSLPSIIPSTERKSTPSILPPPQIDSLPSIIPPPTERKSTPSILPERKSTPSILPTKQSTPSILPSIIPPNQPKQDLCSSPLLAPPSFDPTPSSLPSKPRALSSPPTNHTPSILPPSLSHHESLSTSPSQTTLLPPPSSIIQPPPDFSNPPLLSPPLDSNSPTVLTSTSVSQTMSQRKKPTICRSSDKNLSCSVSFISSILPDGYKTLKKSGVDDEKVRNSLHCPPSIDYLQAPPM